MSQSNRNRRLRELERRLTPKFLEVLFCVNEIPDNVPRGTIVVRMKIEREEKSLLLSNSESRG